MGRVVVDDDKERGGGEDNETKKTYYFCLINWDFGIFTLVVVGSGGRQ